MRMRPSPPIHALPLAGAFLLLSITADAADRPDPAAADRGRSVLTAGSLSSPAWKLDAYKKAGKFWGASAPDPDADPEGYLDAFCRRYGLHPAPFPNDGLPMGMRRAVGKRTGTVGISLDCLVCHGGSIGGTGYVGLGNSTLDLHLLMTEMTLADDRAPLPSPFTINTTRGTVNAGQMSVFLLARRNEDLSFRLFPRKTDRMLPEIDPIAWWNLGPKATMYQDGRTDARSHRSLMQFFLGEFSAQDFRDHEGEYRDALAYFKSLDPPPYPFAVDRDRASRGQAVYTKNCAGCHGTYGPGGAVEYPNVIVELDRIGTDRKRAEEISPRDVAFYNATWFGEGYPVDEAMVGYQAPPLRGVWATAPYGHNGTVPTLAAWLESAERPARFRRPPFTDFAHYDTARVGWKHEAVVGPIDRALPPHEARFYVDTGRYGLGNGGHTFGDKLDDDERMDLIEYLKTL